MFFFFKVLRLFFYVEIKTSRRLIDFTGFPPEFAWKTARRIINFYGYRGRNVDVTGTVRGLYGLPKGLNP